MYECHTPMRLAWSARRSKPVRVTASHSSSGNVMFIQPRIEHSFLISPATYLARLNFPVALRNTSGVHELEAVKL